MKAQEGKIMNTDLLLELTQSNQKLTQENKDLSQQLKDTQDRLQEVESQFSSKLIEDAEKDDQIEGLQAELQVRDQQLVQMEEKNKKLTQECQILTVRILEEKNKMVEIMNEANNMYERGYAGSIIGSVSDKSDFERRKSQLKSQE